MEVNNELAENAGYDSYVDYAYDGYDRDYDSEDADRLCGYVKRYLAPLTCITRRVKRRSTCRRSPPR